MAAAGPSLDVVSWHTYDYETRDLGMSDHTTLAVTEAGGFNTLTLEHLKT